MLIEVGKILVSKDGEIPISIGCTDGTDEIVSSKQYFLVTSINSNEYTLLSQKTGKYSKWPRWITMSSSFYIE